MNKIYNCKERFGYVYIWTCNRTMQNILDAFCEGRGFWWNVFWGWRRTDKDGKQFYWIPKNKLKILIDLADDSKEEDH